MMAEARMPMIAITTSISTSEKPRRNGVTVLMHQWYHAAYLLHPRYQDTLSYMQSDHETIVMSVGGSLIVPDHIDTLFLTSLKNLVEDQIATHRRRFIIIAGGGKTARRYQEAAGAVSNLDPEDLDWMGIHATRLNGHLLRTIFRDTAHPVMITNPDDIIDIPKKVPLIIAAGYRPGASTDLRAVQIAKHVSAHKLINLSNIDYVYTKDPRTNPDAEKIESISWSEFRKIIPLEWSPGLSSPFDPVAAREAEKNGVEVAIINGERSEAIEHYMNGESFIGTLVR
jgi:uridylate kinase